MPKAPQVEIIYCRLCHWGLRASWMAQELLSTFAEEIGSVTLTPDATGGVFEVCIDGDRVWSRKEAGRFPEIGELKRLTRDRIAPGRSLGHIEKG
jgi:selenoprotein W-related protein